MAEAIGVFQSQISTLESGKPDSITDQNLEEISKVLEFDLSDWELSTQQLDIAWCTQEYCPYTRFVIIGVELVALPLVFDSQKEIDQPVFAEKSLKK